MTSKDILDELRSIDGYEQVLVPWDQCGIAVRMIVKDGIPGIEGRLGDNPWQFERSITDYEACAIAMRQVTAWLDEQSINIKCIMGSYCLVRHDKGPMHFTETEEWSSDFEAKRKWFPDRPTAELAAMAAAMKDKT